MKLITAKYRFPKGIDAAKQAKVIAVGQTAGTWDAKWEHLSGAFTEAMGQVGAISENADGSSVAEIKFPLIDFEGDISSLLTILFGKYSMAGPAKLVDVELPAGYGTKAKFGEQGIRKLLGIHDRPLIMAIFKPALGLSAKHHAEILQEVAEAGIDIVKDDEILGNLPSAPTLERVKECRKVLDKQSRNVLYAVNVTGRADTLIVRAKELVKAGANALLLNAVVYGYSVLEAIAADPEISVPVFAHPAFSGAICLSENTGLSYPLLLGILLPAAGADAVLYPSHHGNLPFSKEDEQEIRKRILGYGALPVPSAGIHPGIVPQLLGAYGSNVALNAGTGIMDHPNGAAAGVKAFHEALSLAKLGVPFTLSEISEGPLKKAVEKWGVL